MTVSERNLTEAQPLAHMHFQGGFGRAVFKMKHGSFKVHDRIEEKQPLAVSEGKDGAIRLVSSDSSIAVDVTIETGAYGTRIGFCQTKGRRLNRFWIKLEASAKERIYGCGECFSEFNLKGKTAAIWVAEHQNMSRMFGKILRNTLMEPKPDKKLPFEKYETYYAQPTFMSSNKYYIHVDSDTYMKFRFDEDAHMLYMHELPRYLYIGSASDFETLSGMLQAVLGRQPLIPEWVNDGLIIAVQGDTDALRRKLKTAEAHHIPVAGIWTQDWCGARFTAFGRQVMWNWKWDEGLYPGLDAFIESLHEKGIKFLGYINPFIAIEGDIYKEAHEKGYCIKNRSGEDYLATTTTFPAAMVDFTNPEAWAWYKAIIKNNMAGIGLDGWMADFGEYMPVDACLYDSEDNEKTHNRWPALWAELNHEAVSELGKEGSLFFFTRAGHTKTVRHSMMMWNGDQHVDFSIDDGLASVIPATLSLAMSGFGCTHSDIGGYTTMPKCNRSKELLMRWTELAAFSPAMRCHEGNRPDDNVQFDNDEELLYHTSRMVNIHLMIKSYIRGCIVENHTKGLPVMRPLFYHYDEDQAYDEAYSYMLGSELLCCPVTKEGQIRKCVYLPEDEWIHLMTGEAYGAGRVWIDCPIGMPPVFYRKNGAHAGIFQKVKEYSDGKEKSAQAIQSRQ